MKIFHAVFQIGRNCHMEPRIFEWNDWFDENDDKEAKRAKKIAGIAIARTLQVSRESVVMNPDKTILLNGLKIGKWYVFKDEIELEQCRNMGSGEFK